MHPAEEQQGRQLPGITAIVAAGAGTTQLEGTVLDLAAVLDGLVACNFEIIVVEVTPTPHLDDVLAELHVRYPRLRLHRHERRPAGLAAALAAGFDAAAYDLILVSGTNGEIDIRETNHLLEAIEHGADLAIGYRPRRADGVVRRVYGWGWNVLVGLLFGKAGRDVDCPFKLFRTAVWQRIDLRPRQTSPTFNAELLVRARRQGFRVVEVPVSHRRPRQGVPCGAAGPAEIGRALVELGQLRTRGRVSEPRAQATSRPFARSMQVATEEQPPSAERRLLSPEP